MKILQQKIDYFKAIVARNDLENYFCNSNSPIQVCQIKGNEQVKKLSKKLQTQGFDVRPILSPTVQKGEERLRFCVHVFNTEAAIEGVLDEVKRILNEK